MKFKKLLCVIGAHRWGFNRLGHVYCARCGMNKMAQREHALKIIIAGMAMLLAAIVIS
jgi:hypothetical protein